jgi:glucose/arabinose dehydrogenase
VHLGRVLAVTVALAIGVSACGGGDDSNSNASNTSRPPTTGAATTAATRARVTTTTTGIPNLSAIHIKLTPVVGGLKNPVAFAVRAHDPQAFYVAEQHTGRILRVVNGHVVGNPVLDIGNEVTQGNEQGLLGIVFSNDGRRLYINYTDTSPPAGNTHVQEFTMRGKVADIATRRNVLTVEQPFTNHNGGNLVFGPDNMLYIGLGDGGAAGDPMGNAQNRNVLLGKMLRIDPRQHGNAPYSVPSDNPFVNTANARPEVWMYGLRNPWRYSFDRATGDFWIGDVGQNAWEEIDFAKPGQKGTNWGWDRLEGNHPYEGSAPPNAVPPIFETSHSDGYCAIVGGYVYRGTRIPAMRGAYLFTDNCKSDLLALTQQNGKLVAERPLGVSGTALSSFGEDAKGELYVLSLSGTVYRIDRA